MEEMDSNACVYSTRVKRLFMDEIITGWLWQTKKHVQTVFFKARGVFLWILWTPQVMLAVHLKCAFCNIVKGFAFISRSTKTKNYKPTWKSNNCATVPPWHHLLILTEVLVTQFPHTRHTMAPWTGSCCISCRWWQCRLTDKRKWKRRDDECRNIYLPARSHLDHRQNHFWEPVLRLW